VGAAVVDPCGNRLEFVVESPTVPPELAGAVVPCGSPLVPVALESTVDESDVGRVDRRAVPARAVPEDELAPMPEFSVSPLAVTACP
jgi:hypothetical protein